MNPMHPVRYHRLSRGWQPTQLIGHMKIAASMDGVTLPATWLLLKLLFLWENQRTAIPGYYAILLHRVFTTSAPHRFPGGEVTTAALFTIEAAG